MNNAEIAAQLRSLAQLLSAGGENPFKAKAYRRAAKTIEGAGESVEELVRDEVDLTAWPGIGKGIALAVCEIVRQGKSSRLETLRVALGPEIAAISEYPRLDPARVLRIYKKLKISSVDALKEKLASGEIAAVLGVRMDQHVRQALTESHQALLHDVKPVAAVVEEFLSSKCGVTRVQATGALRRRVEILSEISFLITTPDFAAAVDRLQQFGGGVTALSRDRSTAVFQLSSGILLRVEQASEKRWGLANVAATGSDAHLAKIGFTKVAKSRGTFASEAAVYRKLGLDWIPPELREGLDETDLAAHGALPSLITREDIRGELHAHSTSSDGVHTIAQMASAAAALGYEYTGITDHSKSLKIARGVSEGDLRKQLRFIDKINSKSRSIRILKSAEVDILTDGALDYSDDLLKELDYTVCSIHSKFALGKTEQTERIMRAMDNRYFTILGHATGRRLLKRPGYEIDTERIAGHAGKWGCFFEINSSPERLDLSAEHARIARGAGVKIAITTDAHAMREFNYIEGGVDQARRAGLSKEDVLNTRGWAELQALFRR